VRAFVVVPTLGAEVQGFPRGKFWQMIRQRPVFTAWRAFEVCLAKRWGRVVGTLNFAMDACSHVSSRYLKAALKEISETLKAKRTV